MLSTFKNITVYIMMKETPHQQKFFVTHIDCFDV